MNYSTAPIENDSIKKIITFTDLTDLNKLDLVPNPQLLRGVQSDNDIVVVISTFRWGDKIEKPNVRPCLIFYDL